MNYHELGIGDQQVEIMCVGDQTGCVGDQTSVGIIFAGRSSGTLGL